MRSLSEGLSSPLVTSFAAEIRIGAILVAICAGGVVPEVVGVGEWRYVVRGRESRALFAWRDLGWPGCLPGADYA